MTLKEIIKALKEKGHQVSYRKRSDGSYLITRLDGVRYELSKGNIKAREILGVELSERRKKQLEKIKPPKKVAPSKRRIHETLSKEMIKELRRVQRIRRKEEANGQIGKRGLRRILKEEGAEAVFKYLKASERRAKGLASYEDVNLIVEKLESWRNFSQIGSEWTNLIDLIQNKKEDFLEVWVAPIHDIMYDLERDIYDKIIDSKGDFDSKAIEADAIAQIKAIILQL